ncbi:MAG: 4'-phosphopantetheinyl transferase superfamily protein [Muribaculaceae bacterium]|nr:4'-phosphopantetheinyl transferase superfamily protein [Muribaculaceae bacterium]MDE6612298.1 4'-phosphopantetheinyl transferase superfamily protein [Muribaculaceae bacterium]
MILADTPSYIIYITAIEQSPLGLRHRRREREEAAVAALVTEAFGHNAVRRHDAAGAPVIYIGDSEADCRISLSHSPHYAVLAVGRRVSDIGVDIEEPRASLAKVTGRILSVDEQRRCLTDDDCLRAWTLKEALYKAARRHFDREPAFDTDIPLSALVAGTAYSHRTHHFADALVTVVFSDAELL